MNNNDLDKFRKKELVSQYLGQEYVNVFDPRFQAYLRHFKLNYPNNVYNDVIEHFDPNVKFDSVSQKENSKEDFEFKLMSNIADFDGNTPVCFRLCVENCSEEDLLKLFQQKGIPACKASDDDVSANKWCIAKREYFIGPNPDKRVDCSYIEVDTPLMKAQDAPKELWEAIKSFNSVGGYQRGLLLPIVTSQIVTDYNPNALHKKGENVFLKAIEDTESLYPGFKERLESAPSFPDVPQKDGLLYHGGRIYDSPYKIVSKASKSCIYATPNSQMASGYATSDFKSSLIQGIVHAYKERPSTRFYTDWAIEEYKLLINDLPKTTISRERALARTSETPILASNELAEVWLKIKDKGFVKINPEQEDMKHFLSSIKTYENDSTFLSHRIDMKKHAKQCYRHFINSTEIKKKIDNLRNNKGRYSDSKTISELRGIGIEKTSEPARKTTLDAATVKQRTTQNEG